MDTDESLLDLVFNRLADDRVADEVATLVLAAYTGLDALRAALAGGSVDLPKPADLAGARPDPIYLDTITVSGFRGVGPTASLRLAPHAGLTLVVGRNGSGKSSFAEAVELALTGDSARWAERNSLFREGWRNLHQGRPSTIDVVLRTDGRRAPIRVTRSWSDTATEPGQAESRVEGADLNAWAGPLQTYRPFLTANDLGRLISSTPSGLFDALAPILGMEPITDADKNLLLVRRELTERVREVKGRRELLRAELAQVDDDRARRAVAILGQRQPDLDALDQLLGDAGTEHADPVAAACRRLVAAVVPDADDALRIAVDLDQAARAVAEHEAHGVAAHQHLAALLEQALAYHDAHGDGPCPTCGTGRLDASWRERSASTVARLRTETAAADRAQQRLNDARDAARTMLGVDRLMPLAELDTAAPALGEAAARLHAAVTAWRAVLPQATPEQIAAHIRSAYPPMRQAYAAVQAAAAAWLQQRHDIWREHAAKLQAWLHDARESARDERMISRINAARDWLKKAADELRAQRLAPFARQSQQIWEQLRQESNVELAGMRLDGSNNRRRVAFPATVDGTATSAMAVMSQGELQALGLAVFLPRACADGSPFKFLILDDPVHSMDPAKVDGLAQVLDGLARTRQVVVFTHDNRLPEAIRRLQIDATIWEVLRREGSVVELRKNLDPVRRYLDDAAALAKTHDLPEQVRRPVVAGFCRAAIEAACHERIRRERIGRGEPHSAVEELISTAQTLTQTVALALAGDARQGGSVLPALNRIGGWAADVFKACQNNVHGAERGSLEWMVDRIARLVEELR
jgi:predicted ATPase